MHRSASGSHPVVSIFFFLVPFFFFFLAPVLKRKASDISNLGFFFIPIRQISFIKLRNFLIDF